MSRYCRICRNTSCSNHGKDISFLGEDWQCNYIPVPTNADRIRAMTDEELAASLAKTVIDAMLHAHKMSEASSEVPTEIIENLATEYMEWLKQPAE